MLTYRSLARRLSLVTTLLITLGMLLSACGPAATPAPPTATNPTQAPAGTAAPVATQAPAATAAPTGPVVLHIGWLGKPDTLNPAYAFLTESYTIFDLIFNPLVTESPTGEYVGSLAKSWTHSDDGLVWTFTLKDNIKWHDGTPLTADDVAWSINAVIDNPDGWAALSNYVGAYDADGNFVPAFTEVKALDNKTLQITLAQPIGNMEYRLSFLYALPRKDFEQFTTAEDLQNFTNDQAIGTGPFKLNVFDKDKGVVILDANPDYFDGRPKIDQVVFQTFDNADAMVQALKVGDIDLINEVPQSAFEAVKSFDNVKAIQVPGRYLDELIINSAPADHDPKPTRNPALEDPQVRLALATAINKQDLVDIVLRGLGRTADTIVPPTLGGGFWHNNNIQDVKFDLATANQILEDAGYKIGSDGVRAKGDLRLEFRLQYPSDNSLYPRVADLMSGWFKQIGVKVTPQATDPDSLTAACCPAADYDLILWGWGPDPDPDFILSVLTSDQFVDGGWSDSGYSNPEYDQLYREQQVTVDRTARQQIIYKMQEIAFNDRPYIVYWYQDVLQAYRSDRFKGFIESPLGIEIGLSLLNVEPVQ
jgi:peptide/nickel transport system substrate-binding protein